MVELAPNNNFNNVSRLSPEAHLEAKVPAAIVWKLGNRFIQSGQIKRIPTDPQYLEIIFTGPKELEASGIKKIDLVVDLVSIDCGDELEAGRPLPGESFSFLTTDDGMVVKETRVSGVQQIERHEANKEEIERLLKTIAGSRSIDSCWV